MHIWKNTSAVVLYIYCCSLIHLSSKFNTEMLTLDIPSFSFEGTSSWQQSFERRTESMVGHCRQSSGSIFSNSLIKISEEPCAWVPAWRSTDRRKVVLFWKLWSNMIHCTIWPSKRCPAYLLRKLYISDWEFEIGRVFRKLQFSSPWLHILILFWVFSWWSMLTEV